MFTLLLFSGQVTSRNQSSSWKIPSDTLGVLDSCHYMNNFVQFWGFLLKFHIPDPSIDNIVASFIVKFRTQVPTSTCYEATML